MDLLLKRDTFTDKSTIGKLYINGVFFCDTLEDKVREVKIPKVTAIPAGRYEISLSFSDHFQRLMPLLLHVLNYVGVRIHWGNYDEDTDGCILLGVRNNIHDFIGSSRNTYDKFMAIITKAIKTEKIFITVL